jgi:hypothetical protein
MQQIKGFQSDSNKRGNSGQGYGGVMQGTLKSFCACAIDNPLLHLQLRACNIRANSQH